MRAKRALFVYLLFACLAATPAISASSKGSGKLAAAGHSLKQPTHPESHALPAEDQERENREKADLTAQQSMALSAKRMLTATWIQIALSAIGTILLLVTVKLSRDSTKAAISAVTHAEESAERELRAYVFVDEKTIEDFGLGKQPRIAIRFKNFGQTPAYQCKVTYFKCQISAKEPDFPAAGKFPPLGSTIENLGPSDCRRIMMKIGVIDKNAHTDIISNKKQIFAIGIIEYVDAFGKPRETRFKYAYGRNATVFGNHFSGCSSGNEAT